MTSCARAHRRHQTIICRTREQASAPASRRRRCACRDQQRFPLKFVRMHFSYVIRVTLVESKLLVCSPADRQCLHGMRCNGNVPLRRALALSGAAKTETPTTGSECGRLAAGDGASPDATGSAPIARGTGMRFDCRRQSASICASSPQPNRPTLVPRGIPRVVRQPDTSNDNVPFGRRAREAVHLARAGRLQGHLLLGPGRASSSR